ncbi:transposase [Halomonas sabkhae]|nr:transposase [Halomonas sabkhae]MDN3526389.1 transposase [Halomonas sabkhae]
MPNAAVVYDRFHVVAKYGREVMGRVRVDQANQLRDDKAARKVIIGQPLAAAAQRRHPQARAGGEAGGATGGQCVTDNGVPAKTLWFADGEATARSAWQDRYDMAMGSGIEALGRFAKRLAPYPEGILSSARHRLNTSVLEGMNNRIKVIKRMAYGYRDTEYFFLKIRAALPAKCDEPIFSGDASRDILEKAHRVRAMLIVGCLPHGKAPADARVWSAVRDYLPFSSLLVWCIAHQVMAVTGTTRAATIIKLFIVLLLLCRKLSSLVYQYNKVYRIIGDDGETRWRAQLPADQHTDGCAGDHGHG